MKRIIAVWLSILMLISCTVASAESFSLTIGQTPESATVLTSEQLPVSLCLSPSQGVLVKENDTDKVYRLAVGGVPLTMQDTIGAASAEQLSAALQSDMAALGQRVSELLPQLLTDTDSGALVQKLLSFLQTGELTLTTTEVNDIWCKVLENACGLLWGEENAALTQEGAAYQLQLRPTFPKLLDGLQLSDLYRSVWDQLSLPDNLTVPMHALEDAVLSLQIGANAGHVSFTSASRSIEADWYMRSTVSGDPAFVCDLLMDGHAYTFNAIISDTGMKLQVMENKAELYTVDAALLYDGMSVTVTRRGQLCCDLSAQYRRDASTDYLTAALRLPEHTYALEGVFQGSGCILCLRQDDVEQYACRVDIQNVGIGLSITQGMNRQELFTARIAPSGDGVTIDANTRDWVAQAVITLDNAGSYNSSFAMEARAVPMTRRSELSSDPTYLFACHINGESYSLTYGADVSYSSPFLSLNGQLHLTQGLLNASLDLAGNRSSNVPAHLEVYCTWNAQTAQLHALRQYDRWGYGMAPDSQLDISLYYAQPTYGFSIDCLQSSDYDSTPYRCAYRALLQDNGNDNLSAELLIRAGRSNARSIYAHDVYLRAETRLTRIGQDMLHFELTTETRVDRFTLLTDLRQRENGCDITLCCGVSNRPASTIALSITAGDGEDIHAELCYTTADEDPLTAVLNINRTAYLEEWVVSDDIESIELADLLYQCF